MGKFCISYDLVNDEDDNRNSDYQAIEDKLLYLDFDAENIQKSVWIITLKDHYECDFLKRKLINYFNEEDKLFITKVSADYVLI